MSRIAIISDIHANLPALEAVLADVKKQQIDLLYCLGDIIGKGPSPSECVDLCKKHCDRIILGNWEDFLLNFDMNEDPIRYYKEKLSQEQKNFLRSLDYRIEFYLSGYLVRLFHAHPNDVYRRVFGQSELELLSEMFDEPLRFYTDFPKKKTDIAIYGDIHYAYALHFEEAYYKKYFEKRSDESSYDDFYRLHREAISKTQGRYLINTGSVGQPFDGTSASYLILEGALHTDRKGGFSYTIRRVPYDKRRAAKITLESDMYDKEDYALEILSGIYRGLRKEKK